MYVKFFLDSQAALQALKSKTCKMQTVKDTQDVLNALASQTKQIRLTWVKVHTGLDRNKLADDYVKLGPVDDKT